MIKLVDSWAAQLAGCYALSENYLYTIGAFQQYLQHLDHDGMLVMIIWNFKLPLLISLLVDSLVKGTDESREGARRHIVIVEDGPAVYFGRTSDNQKLYPMLVIVKITPFKDAQLDLANEKAIKKSCGYSYIG